MATRKRFRTWLLLPLLATPLGALADPLYSLTFLPAGFYASGINNAGHVVGTGGGGAAIWTGSGTTSQAALAPGSEGLAINNHDEIAGRYMDQGFLYSGGVLHPIDSAPYRSWAAGINDAARVAGTVRKTEVPPTLSLGFVYVEGAGMTTILTPGGFIDGARAINNAGQIAGFASSFPGGDFGGPNRNAFIYQFDGSVQTLGTLGGSISEANDINDSAQVAGWSTTAVAGEERPFLFDGAVMRDLGSLGGRSGRANGINSAGMVVGMSDIGGGATFDYHAFVYAHGSMTDLNALIDPASGWRLVSAIDINDNGQILGNACMVAGTECRQVRLDLIPAVPEPGTWLMLLGGLALLARARRGRKLLLASLLASPLAAMADPVYKLTFLPADFQAAKINNAGSVVGTYGDAAAIWTTGGISGIGAIAPGSFGNAINNRGDIGVSWSDDAYTYSPGVFRNIGRLGIFDNSIPAAINDAGQVAGIAFFIGGNQARGFVYSDGVVRNIPSFGGEWSQANAINGSGLATGAAAFAGDSSAPYHAFLYQDLAMRDIGTLGGFYSEGRDIDDAGQVVGHSSLTEAGDSSSHPFLYHHGVMSDLGTLGGLTGDAWGVNNAGQIVGASSWSTEPQEFFDHAFLYSNHAMVDLNSLIDPAGGWTLTAAHDINEAGQILATACRAEGCAPVRLDLAVAAVPEPRAWGLLLVGLMLVASRRRAPRAEQPFR